MVKVKSVLNWLIPIGGVFLIVIVAALPHLVMWQKLQHEGKQYVSIAFDRVGSYGQTIGPIAFDEGFFYGPRINRVFRGEGFVGDPEIKEHAKDPYAVPPLGEWIVGKTAQVFGSFNAGYIASDIIWPALAALTIYIFFFLLTKNRLVSFVSLPLILIGLPGIINRPAHWNTPYPLLIFRTPHPQIDLAFLFTSLIFLVMLLRVSKNWQRIVFAVLGGVVSGLLIYSSPYFWTTAIAVVVLMTLLFIILKQRVWYQWLGVLIVVHAITTIPFWRNMGALKKLSQYADIFAATGGVMSRTLDPLLIPLFTIGAIAVFVFYRFKFFSSENKTRQWQSWFMIFLFVAPIGLRNVQVITGYTVQYSHWFYYIARYVWPIVLLYALAQTQWISKRVVKGTLITLSALTLIWAFSMQYNSAVKAHEFFAVKEDRAQAYQWINEHAAFKTVLVIPKNFNDLFLESSALATFTQARSYLGSAGVSLASRKELATRLRDAAGIATITDIEFQKFVNHEDTQFRLSHFDGREPLLSWSCVYVKKNCQPSKEPEVVKNPTFAPTYALEYLMVIGKERETPSIAHGIKPIVEYGDMRIYTLGEATKK